MSYLREERMEAINQIRMFMVNNWLDMNGNEKEAFLTMLKSTVEDFEEEFKDRYGGNCKLDVDEECKGCGNCGELREP